MVQRRLQINDFEVRIMRRRPEPHPEEHRVSDVKLIGKNGPFRLP